MTKARFNLLGTLVAALVALAITAAVSSAAITPLCTSYGIMSYNPNRTALVGTGTAGCVGGKFISNDMTTSLEYKSKYTGWQNGPYIRRVITKRAGIQHPQFLCGDIDGHRAKWLWRIRVEGKGTFKVGASRVTVPYSFLSPARTIVC